MLKALPIQSKNEQEVICARCGVEYDADLLAYVVTVDETLVGISQFKITAEGGSIRCLKMAPDANDTQAMFVLGRAVLNFIDLCGIHIAYYDGDDADTMEPLLKKVGFIKDEESERFTVNLIGFFDHPCQHD